MLAPSKEGKIILEDLDGSVDLDFSKLVSPENHASLPSISQTRTGSFTG
jgi:hypothetical protein